MTHTMWEQVKRRCQQGVCLPEPNEDAAIVEKRKTGTALFIRKADFSVRLLYHVFKPYSQDNVDV